MFYKKELPCIVSILRQIDLSEVVMIIVDGFVYLDDQNSPGLGAYLYKYLNNKIPVIGVAKRDFATIETNRMKVLRGNSTKPLYVSSIGIDLNNAGEQIKNMLGSYRIPKLLKELDQLTKSNL